MTNGVCEITLNFSKDYCTYTRTNCNIFLFLCFRNPFLILFFWFSLWIGLFQISRGFENDFSCRRKDNRNDWIYLSPWERQKTLLMWGTINIILNEYRRVNINKRADLNGQRQTAPSWSELNFFVALGSPFIEKGLRL